MSGPSTDPGWAVVLLVVGVVLTALVLTEATNGFDASLLAAVVPANGSALVHAVARTVVMGGQFWLVGLLVGLAAVWAAVRTRNWRLVIVPSISLVLLDSGLWLLKHLSGRTAPHSGLNDALAGGTSYPSGHAASATLGLLLLALALARGFDWGRRAALTATWVACMFSGLVGLSTIVLGYHWPTDVLGGWIVGALVFLGTLTTLGSDPRTGARWGTRRGGRPA